MSFIRTATLITTLTFMPANAYAHDTHIPAGTVIAIEGSADITRHDKTSALSEDDRIYMDDTITTAEDTKLLILFDDQTEFALAENASLDIDEYVYDADETAASNMKLSILRGTFSFASGLIEKDKVSINVPYGSIGIRGTKFLAGDLGGKYGIFVDKGAVDVSNDAGSVIVGTNEGTKLSAADVPPSIPGIWSEGHKIQLKNELRFDDFGKVRNRLKENKK